MGEREECTLEERTDAPDGDGAEGAVLAESEFEVEEWQTKADHHDEVRDEERSYSNNRFITAPAVYIAYNR